MCLLLQQGLQHQLQLCGEGVQKEQMERMGDPAYQQEGKMDANMGHEGMYGMDGNTEDERGRRENL